MHLHMEIMLYKGDPGSLPESIYIGCADLPLNPYALCTQLCTEKIEYLPSSIN